MHLSLSAKVCANVLWVDQLDGKRTAAEQEQLLDLMGSFSHDGHCMSLGLRQSLEQAQQSCDILILSVRFTAVNGNTEVRRGKC